MWIITSFPLFKLKVNNWQFKHSCASLDLKASRAVCEGIHVVAGWGQCGRTKHMREKGFTPVMSVTRLSSFCKRLTSTHFGSKVAMCLSARIVARSSRPTKASTDTRRFLVARLTTSQLEIYYNVFFLIKKKIMFIFF